MTAAELDLLQIVSHEFRTPLTVLLAGVDVLRHQAHLSPELQEVLDAMARASRRLDRLIGQASEAVDRGEQRTAVRLGQVLDDLGDKLDRERRRRLRVHVGPGLRNHLVAGQATWRVLAALLDNAYKFSPEDSLVVVDAVEEGSTLVVRIHDDGPGMDESFRHVAFDAFRQQDMRTAREHPGLGLGLFTARRWAQEAGGRLVFESTDEGTIAALHLPSHIDITSSGATG